MSYLNFRRAQAAGPETGTRIATFLADYSIEVMPRTADAIPNLREVLPAGTRVYIAQVGDTPITDMVVTAARLRREGFEPMPHFPARLIRDRATLADWVARYRGEADLRQALLIGGGLTNPSGDFDNSMQLLGTGLFDGFERLHVAGHPEGNRDIDPDDSDRNVMAALRWKQAFAERSDARMAVVTQFAFESAPVIAWADRLAAEGIALPIHIGIAGPAKLQTLIRFAIACGVGPSLRVLQRRARDVTRLVRPFEPTEIVTELAAHKARHPGFGIEAVHLFPLGGVRASAEWAARHGGAAAQSARAKDIQ